MILSVLFYDNDKGKGTRLSYVLTQKDNFVNNEKFKGFTEIGAFYFGEQGKEVFDKITPEMIGKPLDANFITRKDYKNPLKSTDYLESFEFNGSMVRLVQSKD